MTTTLTLPSGSKVTSASKRRFVLVRDGIERPYIVKRSDKVATLRTEVSRLAGRGSFGPYVIVDTTTKEVIR